MWIVFFIWKYVWRVRVHVHCKKRLGAFPSPAALQRQNAENLKQIFPEKEYQGLSPNFHIYVSVSEL